MNNTKKSFFSTLFAFMAAFLLFSCQKPESENKNPIVQDKPEPEEPAAPYIKAEPLSLSFSHEGGELKAKVEASRPVEVKSSEDWCKAELSLLDTKGAIKTYELNVTVGQYEKGRSALLTLSAEGCEDLNIEIIQERLLSDKCGLLSFSLESSRNNIKEDLNFVFDEKSSTYSAVCLKWIEGEEPHLLIPTFKTDGERVFVGEAQIESGKTALSFSDDFKIKVVAEKGNHKEYNIVFNCPQINKELPVLHMKPERLISSKEFYVKTHIELYDKTPASTGKGWWNSANNGKIEMKGRGNSTWGLPKKPFRMKFPEKFSPVGLEHAKAKSWVLLAQDMDKSLIRTHIAFEYSKIMYNPSENYHDEKALLFTPASKFINVYFTGDYFDVSTGTTRFMNGEYLGIYQMSDQMERDEGRIAVEKLTKKDGKDPAKITGGYIIEADLHEGHALTFRKGIKLTYKYPKDDDHDPAQYSYISRFIGDMEAALYGPGYKDPVNGWRKYLDEKTLADYIIIKEFVGDLDGYTSTYMYKRRGVDKLFFGPIWDCDKGWNNDKRVPHWEYQPLQSLMIYAGFWMPPYVHNDWFQRLWSDETFRAFVNNRWKAKKAELEAVTRKMLDQMPASFKKSVKANFQVWPFYYQYSSEANMPAGTYEEEIARIGRLSSERAALLDVLFAK